MVYCNFKDCINADKCGKVLTDEEETERRHNDIITWFYKDKPECYVKDPNKQY